MTKAKDIVFDRDDMALVCLVIRHLQDAFDYITPGFTMLTEVGIEKIIELNKLLGRQRETPGGVIVRMTHEDLADLYTCIFWSGKLYSESRGEAGIPGETRMDLVDRLSDLEDQYFPRDKVSDQDSR